MKPKTGLFLLLVVAFVGLLASCQNRHTVRYPFGPADFDLIDQDTTVSITVRNGLTYFEIDTLDQLTTVNATTSAGLPNGAMLYLKLRSDGTARHVVPGNNFEGDTIDGTINKVKVAAFIWDGDNFVHLSTQQLD